MPDNETNENTSEVSSDEDWKARVKDEDAALDEQLAQEAAQKTKEPDAGAGEAPTPQEPEPAAETKSEAKPSMSFPPADFSIVVAMFSTQAMVALGAIPNPATGKAEVEPELARHLIDLIGVLDQKTKGNLDKDEAEMMEATLHHLRMSFLEQSRAQKS